MELLINVEKPEILKEEILKLIEGEYLKTWELHNKSEDKYLKHTGQWGNKGVIELKSDISNKNLVVKVLKFKNFEGEVKDLKGYYYGDFVKYYL